MAERQIIALGGGGFSMEPDNPLLDRFVLSRARRAAPNVCFVPTASGDSADYIERFHAAFAEHDCRPTELQLFMRTVHNLEAFLLGQDVIYVGGGNTANLLAVWRRHGLHDVLRRAWEEGIVLCGISAGMNCWFEQSVTDSFDVNQLQALNDGLGCCQAAVARTTTVRRRDARPTTSWSGPARSATGGLPTTEPRSSSSMTQSRRLSARDRLRPPTGCASQKTESPRTA